MKLFEIPKASKAQDKNQYPSPRLLKSMELIGYLETSKHQVLLQENNLYYSLYSFDIEASNGFGIKIPYSSYVQLHKKLFTHIHENIQADSFMNNSPQICWSYVSTTYKGCNIGIDMYNFIIKKYGGLWSDVKHSEGARKLWEQVCSQNQVSLIDFETGTIVKEKTLSYKDGWYEKQDLMLFAKYE